MNRTLMIAFLSVVMFLPYIASGNTSQVGNLKSPTAPLPAPLEAVTLAPLMNSGMPIKVETATVERVGRNSILNISVTNLSSQTVTNIHFFLLYSSAKHKSSRAEGWSQTVTIAPFGALDLSIPLKKKVWRGSQGVIGVRAASSQEARWDVKVSDLLTAMAVKIGKKADSHPDVTFSPYLAGQDGDDGPAMACSPSFCTDNALAAGAVCGTGNVQDFTCTQSTCTVSWTCGSGN